MPPVCGWPGSSFNLTERVASLLVVERVTQRIGFATGEGAARSAPDLGPQDFHAYVEVFLSGRWYMFDPSGTAIPMGFVRFCTGRDASDSAFATLFGGVSGAAPVIQIEAIPNSQGVLVLPHHVPYALSTDGQWV